MATLSYESFATEICGFSTVKFLIISPWWAAKRANFFGNAQLVQVNLGRAATL